MSGHSTADATSRALCDQLLAELRRSIPEIERSSTQESCGLFRKGWTRFAYVYHTKTLSHVEVWCRGDVDHLQREAGGLEVRPREKFRPGWEVAYPARFRIELADEIATAATLLLRVSYRASTQR